ncbi:tagatose-6-phosphate ketose/aldose isomerase [Motilibacter peucedani]|uniref:Tagatose-6-phosphate ketose/aldose isomerase n=1 Tax=Motilibacter peucedani TaxID=598650 RepID=A0A420XQH0_9ACTN|nr:SIS domain-containing protein [Motilibacter peucedani]RKS75487.1 tagatose-6-phosphate ketose/aldose isomerase [Motilibacter peucedani]
MTTKTPIDWAARGAAATAREIEQQPALWREVAAQAAAGRTRTAQFLSPLLALPDLRVVLTGAGTSAFAGGLLAPALARRLGRRVEAVATTDIVSNPREVFAEDVPTLLVSFARSGDSPESVAATVLAEQCLRQVHHLVVTCNADGQLSKSMAGAERAHVLLMPEASNDEGFAMTSSFTCMVLATWLALSGDDAQVAVVDRLADAGEQLLSARSAAVEELAGRGYRRVVYLGSGPLCALARESALKLLELSAGTVVSYFDSALGFRHGPKSVLDDSTLTVVFVSNDPYTRQYDEDIAAELLSSQHPRDVLVVAGGPSARLDAPQVWSFGLDDVADPLLGLPFVVLAQLLALHTSLALGLTPDNPFPAGEVNRVVQGVTVHELADERR